MKTIENVMMNRIRRGAPTVWRVVDSGTSSFGMTFLMHHLVHQDMALIESAMRKILSQGANPWVFGGAEHFEQFAEELDRQALKSLTHAECQALCPELI